jgi:hypothetical protein
MLADDREGELAGMAEIHLLREFGDRGLGGRGDLVPLVGEDWRKLVTGQERFCLARARWNANEQE